MKFYPVRDNGTVKIYAVSKTVPWPTHDSFEAAKTAAMALCQSERAKKQVMKIVEAEPYPLKQIYQPSPIKLDYARD